jgi:LysR family hydrogen peroxide-inducible transcriptional activator
MEIHQLRYFLAVARLRSFTRAAEREHVAQPSLSQQIRKLEDELGARLFNRLGRKVTLTPFGERFEQHAYRALAELEGAKQELAALTGLRTGNVSVGVIPTVAPYVLPGVLTAFASRHPAVKVNVREDLTNSLVAQLEEGTLDLAILSLPVRRADLLSETLIEDPLLLAVPATHRLARLGVKRVSFGDVAAEPFLLLKDGHCFRDDVLGLCRRARLKPNVVFEGGQLDTLVAMVVAETGVTLLPQMARQHYRQANLKLLEFYPPRPARQVGVVRLRGRFVTPAAAAFLETMRRVITGHDGGAERISSWDA